MIPPRHRTAARIVAFTGMTAAAWLLLFVAPELLDAHSDAGLAGAIAVFAGVPAVVAWGGTRLWPFLDPKDDDDER